MPTDSKRTYGLHIYSPIASDYRIEIEREIVRTYENGDTARIGKRIVQRKMSALAAKTLPGGPLTITTFADLAAVIAASAAALADEDEAVAAAEAAAIAAAAANNAQPAPAP